MDELDRLRGQIDTVDKEIISLFEKRMGLVQGVAEYKKAHNTAVLQTSREDEVLKKAVENVQNKEYAESARQLMVEIMGLSKDLQRKKISKFNLLGSYKRKPLDLKGKKGYYGDKGSNSQQAMIDFFGDDDGDSFATFEDIFVALKDDKIQYGVLPIENSSTGAITEVYDLLRKYDFFIVGEQWQGINHCLLGVAGTKLEDVKEVYSHPQAITQCDNYLSGGKWTIIPYKSTASSAKFVAEQKDKSKTAIASKRNAQLYGLDVIAENIQSQSCNYTRFIVIGKNLLESDKSDKTSIVFALNSTPGALFNALKYFAKNGINLLNIESRPVENSPERYYFYVDLEYPCNSEKLNEALEYVAEVSSFFEIIGEYAKGQRV
ncbi:MAG: prephenate dehydratase [Clostridia bacterium]|nr:prephenate dehydratase [Clostridia bacterium]